MKKFSQRYFFPSLRVLLLAVWLFQLTGLWAVPAHPGKLQVRQPDGTMLTLCLKGDEWCHYHTTADGYTVVKDSLGYYVYAELEGGVLKATAMTAHDEGERSAEEVAFLENMPVRQVPAMTPQILSMKQQAAQATVEHVARRRAGGTNFANFKGLIILAEYALSVAFGRFGIFLDHLHEPEAHGIGLIYGKGMGYNPLCPLIL